MLLAENFMKLSDGILLFEIVTMLLAENFMN
jgi:hypothetical protein